MKRTSCLNKNGIPRISAGQNTRSALIFEVSPETRSRLRLVSEKTGISQRKILEAGARRQLREIERQLKKGIVGLSDASNS
jgi:hypothetical protein